MYIRIAVAAIEQGDYHALTQVSLFVQRDAIDLVNLVKTATIIEETGRFCGRYSHIRDKLIGEIGFWLSFSRHLPFLKRTYAYNIRQIVDGIQHCLAVCFMVTPFNHLVGNSISGPSAATPAR